MCAESAQDWARPGLAGYPELQEDSPLNSFHVLRRDLTETGSESLLAGGGELIRHGFARFPIELDERFSRVDAGGLRREWDHQGSIESLIGGIVTDDDRWARLLDFTTDRRIEGEPINLTALQGRLQGVLRSRLRLRPRVGRRLPSRDSPRGASRTFDDQGSWQR